MWGGPPKYRLEKPKKCKCVDFVISCWCERADKVLEEQSGVRKVIGGTDFVETTKLQKKIYGKESESKRHRNSI